MNVNKHGGKRKEYLSGVKTAQNSKKEGEIEKNIYESVKLKEDVPGRFYFEKN